MQQTNNKISALMGFSIKSGSIIYGYDNIMKSRKKMHLIATDSTTSPKAIEHLTIHCNKNSIALIKFTTVNLSELLHKENIKVVAFTNLQLAKSIFLNDLEIFEILKRGVF